MKAVTIVALVTRREDGCLMKVETYREEGFVATDEALTRRIEEVLRERAALGEVAYVYGVVRHGARS